MGVENSKADHIQMIRLAVFIGRLLLREGSGHNMLPADDWGNIAGNIALFLYPPHTQKTARLIPCSFFDESRCRSRGSQDGSGMGQSCGGCSLGGLRIVRDGNRPAATLSASAGVTLSRSYLAAGASPVAALPAGFFTYLSSQAKNSRFQTSEFCGLNT